MEMVNWIDVAFSVLLVFKILLQNRYVYDILF